MVMIGNSYSICGKSPGGRGSTGSSRSVSIVGGSPSLSGSPSIGSPSVGLYTIGLLVVGSSGSASPGISSTGPRPGPSGGLVPVVGVSIISTSSESGKLSSVSDVILDVTLAVFAFNKNSSTTIISVLANVTPVSSGIIYVG